MPTITHIVEHISHAPKGRVKEVATGDESIGDLLQSTEELHERIVDVGFANLRIPTDILQRKHKK
jgi:hypothetical protein